MTKKMNAILILMAAMLFCVLMTAKTGFAQMPAKTPTPNAANSNYQFDYASSFTNALQMKDIKTTDNYYAAVQNMIDKYDLMYSYTDGKFHADLPLKREQLTVFLASGLDKLTQIIGDKNGDLSTLVGSALGKKDGTKVFYSDYSAHKLNVDKFDLSRTISVSEIKDLKESDPVYTHVQSLCERYGIDLLDADFNLRASKSVSGSELSGVMEGVFGTSTSMSAAIGHAETIDRGTFIKVFNQAMEDASRKIK